MAKRISTNTESEYTVGQRLKKERNKLGKTQQEFADLLHISRESYQRYERDICNIPYDILLELHVEYGIDLNYLLCGPDHKNMEQAAQNQLIVEIVKMIDREYHTALYDALCGTLRSSI